MLTAEGLLMLLVWWVARVVVRRRHRREVRQFMRTLDRAVRETGAQTRGGAR